MKPEMGAAQAVDTAQSPVKDARCECGHPKSAHTFNYPHQRCHATVYENVPGGMDAWPCPCRKFTHPPPPKEGS